MFDHPLLTMPRRRTVRMADAATPADPGPYYIGYGDDWQTFDKWDEAWARHVIRGTSLGNSRIEVDERVLPTSEDITTFAFAIKERYEEAGERERTNEATMLYLLACRYLGMVGRVDG